MKYENNSSDYKSGVMFSFDVGRLATLDFSIRFLLQDKRPITWWNKAAPSKSQVEVAVEPSSYFANDLSIILALTEQQKHFFSDFEMHSLEATFPWVCVILFFKNLIQNMTSC